MKKWRLRKSRSRKCSPFPWNPLRSPNTLWVSRSGGQASTKCFISYRSFYSSPGRIRLFNHEVCIVIYGCAVPLSDVMDTSKELESQLKVLADRNRLRILRLLSGQREYGAKIAEYLGITTATVSHHLELLKKTGLVQEEKVGNIKYFTCDKEKVDQLLNGVRKFLGT